MVCCVEAYGFYKINSQKIKRINKTEASVREPPAQVFSKRNLLQKTGQPTLIFPDRTDSASVPSLRPDVEELQTEQQPTTPHEDNYNFDVSARLFGQAHLR